jgi:N-acylneuraminate cytidylyltransferase
VVPLPKGQCPHYLMKLTDDGFLDYFMPDGGLYTRRQDVPQAYRRDGTIYLTRTPVILEQRSFYGRRSAPMLMPEAESLNIDDRADWDEAVRRLTVA